MSTSILIVDDHTIFRAGLITLLEKETDMVVIAEAGTGTAAVQLAREQHPDIILMDINMPGMNGIDATSQIVSERDTRILALSMEADRRFIVDVLKAGAAGYLLKDCAFAELAGAIRIVSAGETYLPQKISTLLVKEFLHCIPEEMTSAYNNLTPREREVLQQIADGKSIKEIAHDLGISNKTVENQRQAMMQKLNLYSIAELTKFAVRHGLSSLN